MSLKDVLAKRDQEPKIATATSGRLSVHAGATPVFKARQGKTFFDPTSSQNTADQPVRKRSRSKSRDK